MLKKLSGIAVVVAALWCTLGAAEYGSAQQPPEMLRPPGQGAPAATVTIPGMAQPAPPLPTPQPQAQRPLTNTPMPATPAIRQSANRRVVDFEADRMQPVKLMNDSTALSLSGKVVFFHNGAVIQCDSAIRYNDRRMECFGNVVINKKTTFVYGDRADYNGEINTARVYAPIIKVVDDDVVMHTYNFAFNTLTNTGLYSGRGTVKQKDNLMESDHGYYYADTRTVVCVGQAELRNDEYRLRSDSLSYNMNTQLAEFYTKSFIWNRNNEMLSALRGAYDRPSSTYHFRSNSYVLTKDREMWADTLDYNGTTQDAQLLRNIQIRDDSNKVMAFGDYGLYWGKREEAMLTRNPQVLNFDSSGKEDTLYMRSDSMFLYTVTRESAEKIKQIARQTADEEILAAPTDLLSGSRRPAIPPLKGSASAPPDSLAPKASEVKPKSPTTEEPSATADPASGLSKSDQRRLEKAQARAARQSAQSAKDKQNPAKPAGEGAASPQQTALRPPVPATGDSVTSLRKDSLSMLHTADSLLSVAHTKTDSLISAGSKKSGKQDSLVRVVRAYYNVRIFRKDFQSVCDSLVGFTIDSTIHMYIKPVLWNGDNQITAELIDIYTRNQALDKAIFTGDPIMSSKIDTMCYNQVKGKVIETYFKQNEIYRTDVNGNGQTLYYMSEQDSLRNLDITGFLVAECANITFDIDNREVKKITYKGNPVYSIYPMNMIPAEQERRLVGFTWQADRKPTLEQVFNRRIRPSQRVEYEAMPEPQFPITGAITAHITQMIKDGIWRDRNDIISEEAQQFIQSLSR